MKMQLSSIALRKTYAFSHKSNMILTSKASKSISFSSSSTSFKSLLSGDECVQLHKSSNVKFLDGSFYLGNTRDPRVEFLSERIPHAQYFDISRICDKSNSVPLMLPTANQFAEDVSDLGISNYDHVVIYTKEASFSAPRVWFTFRAFGHKKVSILNGGIAAWKASGGAVEVGVQSAVKKGNYTATLDPKMVMSWQDVLNAVNTGSSQIVDARSSGRFRGTLPEPRAGLAAGHIPGSLNLPFEEIVKPDDYTTFRSKEEIQAAFQAAGVVRGSRAILTCGGGVTACTLAFGLHLIGDESLTTYPIYDGSWMEWGAREDLPKAK